MPRVEIEMQIVDLPTIVRFVRNQGAGADLGTTWAGRALRLVTIVLRLCAPLRGHRVEWTNLADERREYEPGSHCYRIGLRDRAGVGEGTGGEWLRRRHHLSHGRSRSAGDA